MTKQHLLCLEAQLERLYTKCYHLYSCSKGSDTIIKYYLYSPCKTQE